MGAEEVYMRCGILHRRATRRSVVCCMLYLQMHDGVYDKRELGVLLGFSLSDYQLEGEYIRYYDVAERKIFEDLLKKVEDEHLIDVCEKSLRLTSLGEISVKNKHSLSVL